MCICLPISRHDRVPVLLAVRALRAHKAGISFYLGNDDVWLAEPIPPEYIDPLDPEA